MRGQWLYAHHPDASRDPAAGRRRTRAARRRCSAQAWRWRRRPSPAPRRATLRAPSATRRRDGTSPRFAEMRVAPRSCQQLWRDASSFATTASPPPSPPPSSALQRPAPPPLTAAPDRRSGLESCSALSAPTCRLRRRWPTRFASATRCRRRRRCGRRTGPSSSRSASGASRCARPLRARREREGGPTGPLLPCSPWRVARRCPDTLSQSGHPLGPHSDPAGGWHRLGRGERREAAVWAGARVDVRRGALETLDADRASWYSGKTSSRSSCTPTRRRSAVHEIVLQPSRVFSYIRRSTTTSGLGSASRARRWRVAEREGETIGERSRAVGMRRTRSSTFSLWRPPPDLRPRTRRASLATSSRAAQTRRPGARVRSSCPAPARPTLRSTDSLRRRDNTFGRGARRAALVARAAPVDASDRQLRPRFAHRSLHFGLCPAPDAQCHE